MSESALLDTIYEDLEKDQLDLPTLPQVALDIRNAIDVKMAGVQEVACVLSRDSSFAMRVMQIANSALYKTTEPCLALTEAVRRLGMEVVKTVVYSLAIQQMFQPSSQLMTSRFIQAREQSLRTAVYSRALTTCYTELDPNVSVLAGLVLEIGALPLMTYAERHPELHQNMDYLNSLIGQRQKELGVKIAREWELPEEITEVIEKQKDPHHLKSIDYNLVVSSGSYLACREATVLSDISEREINEQERVFRLLCGQAPDEMVAGIRPEMEKVKHLFS